jgi:hypothetical protein
VLLGETVEYGALRVGDEVVLDGIIPVVVTKSSVYVNASQAREVGYSVRPVDGGRARPVSVSRLRYWQSHDA